MKKTIITLVIIAAIAASVGGYYYTRPAPEPKVSTAQVGRGDITEAVSATGTLDAVTAVTVGSQVGGIIQEIPVDFNRIVRKGDVLLKINPDNINTQIEQAKATLVQRQADLERSKVSVEDARVKLRRTSELFAKKLSTQSDLDSADVAMKSAQASQKSSEAALTQAQANLDQQKVNLSNTIITSPIDGIIINRAVDVGQTVQANYQSPTLFVVAADLTKMKCTANIDESDVGKIRPGQNVRFRLDAYPNESFTGTVVQVRLQPIVVQNVVTYGTVIEVPNNDLKLKPGMTANVQIEIAKKTDVVRVPNTAIRFRPTEEIFQAFNQEMPAELQPRARGARGGAMAGGPGNNGGAASGQTQGQNARAGSPAATPGAAPATSAGSQPQANATARGGGDRFAAGSSQMGSSRPNGAGSQFTRGGGDQGSRGGRRGFDPNDPQARQRMIERYQQMPADQRAQWAARMKDRGIDIEALVKQNGKSPAASKVASQAMVGLSGATTIDALFGPLPPRVSSGRVFVWVPSEKKLKLVQVRLGITDQQYTELLSGELQPGMDLVTSVMLGNESANRNPSQSANPLLQQQRGGPGQMGGGRGR
jgi:HlyD family secretion protein